MSVAFTSPLRMVVLVIRLLVTPMLVTAPPLVAGETAALLVVASLDVSRLDSAGISTGRGRAGACRGCYKIKPGQPGGVGPDRWHVFNRASASQAGFVNQK